jgi:hypothetical protein
MALLLGSAVLGSVPGIGATEFSSTGDLITGWYWIRDYSLQHYAEWTFEGIPAGTEDLTLEISALATDRVNGEGGFPAEFLLSYGVLGSESIENLLETQIITLPNVSPPDDPIGYTCRGEVTIPRAALHGGSTLFLRAVRTLPDASHVAFNRESIIILVPLEEAPALEFEAVRPSDFVSTGDSILETIWCRRPGHSLEWTWGPLNEEGGAIVEAAVNFNLLVTNTFDGGSGFSSSVPITIFNLDNEVVELGILELTNTFRPKFSGDTGGIGYATSGTHDLKNSDLILNGFRLRLTWPAIAPLDGEVTTGTPRHFGGNKTSALLAYVVDRSTQNAPAPLQVTLSDLLNDPMVYEGKPVNLEAEFYGWAGGLAACPPPLTRSDWLIGSDGGYLYVTGSFPPGLSPWETLNYGVRISLGGIVRIKRDTPDLVCPYIELQTVKVMEDQEK